MQSKQFCRKFSNIYPTKFTLIKYFYIYRSGRGRFAAPFFHEKLLGDFDFRLNNKC